MDPLTMFEDLIIKQSTEEMLERIFNVGFMTMIIAMKGEPYTGKTTCADAIAKAYNCSVISFDHILDSLSPSAPPSREAADGLIDVAFDIVLRVVRLQMKMGRPVIIDSPLTKPTHLEKLLAVADEFQSCGNPECDKLHCRSVVVECKPGTKYTWEKRFDDRVKAGYDAKWYKPKTWNDIIPEFSTNPSELPCHVCWLTVDTTHFLPANYRNLGPATLDLCMCPKGHLLNFRDWLPHRPYHVGFNPTYTINKISGRSPPSQKSEHLPDGEAPPVTAVNCGDDGRHKLEKVTANNLAQGLERCRACHIDISYPEEEGYVCTRCRLTLHKSCAELEEKATIPDPHTNLPPFLGILSSADEFYSSIPEEYKKDYKCSSCGEFSVDCEFCLWEMHLGSRLVPTMVLHEGHEGGSHPVCFWITSAANHGEYPCDACKLPCVCAGYTCLEGTFKVNYHVECALLPRPVRHSHCGHHHDMELVFGTNEIKEDYLCNVCQEWIRDPAAWYYYCHNCDYVSHLKCIYDPDEC